MIPFSRRFDDFSHDAGGRRRSMLLGKPQITGSRCSKRPRHRGGWTPAHQDTEKTDHFSCLRTIGRRGNGTELPARRRWAAAGKRGPPRGRGGYCGGKISSSFSSSQFRFVVMWGQILMEGVEVGAEGHLERDRRGTELLEAWSRGGFLREAQTGMRRRADGLSRMPRCSTRPSSRPRPRRIRSIVGCDGLPIIAG